jgi:hypothetical protein
MSKRSAASSSTRSPKAQQCQLREISRRILPAIDLGNCSPMTASARCSSPGTPPGRPRNPGACWPARPCQDGP